MASLFAGLVVRLLGARSKSWKGFPAVSVPEATLLVGDKDRAEYLREVEQALRGSSG